MSVTGGHLGAGLGVVEMTVALHAVFDAPRDRIIWDVSHQTYPHKILTGRRDRIRTLRQKDGLSGFTKRSESPYDPFGAAHSSTSISAALGFAVARDLGGAPDHGIGDVVAVIGDGAMSAGMAYEAMNNAGHLGKRLIVILNDNEMSIAPPVGAMSAYLSRLYAGAPFQELKAAAKGAVSLLPPPFREGAKRAKDMLKHLTVGGTLFEELGFSYRRPDRRPRHGKPPRRAAHGEGAGDRADPDPRHHPQGQGLCPGRSGARPRPRRRQVRRGDRRAGQGGLERAVLHLGLRQGADRRGRARSADRRRHGRDAGRHRPQPLHGAFRRRAASTSASPSSTR